MRTDDDGNDIDQIAHPDISNIHDVPGINGVPDNYGAQNDETPGDTDDSPTKRRILDCAATLFATKGFTETSVRELATAAGLQGSSVYNHFASKTAILEYMLDEYVSYNHNIYFNDKTRRILEDNPTSDGILTCLRLTFEDDKADYHYKLLSTIMQEQHRIPYVSEYVRGSIAQTEQFTKLIIDTLKDLKVLKPDTDPDFWMKMSSCLFYTFSNRAVMGCGDTSPDYKGLGMVGLLEQMFKRMLLKCGVDSP